jgi:hypothetical protein
MVVLMPTRLFLTVEIVDAELFFGLASCFFSCKPLACLVKVFGSGHQPLPLFEFAGPHLDIVVGVGVLVLLVASTITTIITLAFAFLLPASGVVLLGQVLCFLLLTDCLLLGITLCVAVVSVGRILQFLVASLDLVFGLSRSKCRDDVIPDDGLASLVSLTL